MASNVPPTRATTSRACARSIARQYRDFDPAFLDILRSITAVGNAKGHSVRFRDVVRGPFSSDELLLIGRAVRESQGTSQDRAIVMLHLELGHNPNASARLRNSDLICYETKSGVVWQLDVPRVKKRTPRRETKRRPISDALGRLLKNLEEGGPEDLCSIGCLHLIQKEALTRRCGALRKQQISSRHERNIG
jgi:hypothetical protein